MGWGIPGFTSSRIHQFPEQALVSYMSTVEVFWKHCGKRINCSFILFLLCFLPIWIIFCHFHQIWNCRLQNLSVWWSLKFVIWERVKVFYFGPLTQTTLTSKQCSNKPLFLRVCNSSLMKTLWEKEKLLVMSNFSFSLQCFLPICRIFHHFL